MKELVYLDNEFINSFISQMYNGLPINLQNSKKETDQEESAEQSAEKTATSQTGSIGLYKGKYDFETSESDQHMVLQSLETQEIISKKMYDNALNDFEKYLSSSDKLIEDVKNIKKNNFIKIKIPFRIINLELLKTLYEGDIYDAVVFFSNSDDYEKINTIKHDPGLSSSARNAQTKSVENNIKKNNDVLDLNYKRIQSLFKGTLPVLPTKFYLKSDNLVVPLNEKYFRENPISLDFKYSSDNPSDLNYVTLVGKVTNKSKKILDERVYKMPEMAAYLSQFNLVFEEFFKIVDLIEDNNFIISPIAIYFDDGIDLF
ncbi:DUF6414 family protein [Listeria seeligeri]|uniref:DUF6414 family protein n=1 Tax=Listeria seeligeri TaxID=1640 RepID=UPI001627B349|nr:hypothetical protein [Listeria seeligeri]MBC1722298.1 hypothetical protein [Listeria seeligeri]MBF2435825.1 hypothetical protein [Listeria seeligeri]